MNPIDLNNFNKENMFDQRISNDSMNNSNTVTTNASSSNGNTLSRSNRSSFGNNVDLEMQMVNSARLVSGDTRMYYATSKLRHSASTSALFAGFALVALVEMDLNANIPEVLFILFAICTSLLIFVHLIALLIATCLIPTAEGYCELTHREQQLPSSLVMKESFLKLTQRYIALAWFFTTVLGTFLFMIEIIVVAWVRFYIISRPACYAVTAIIVPLMIVSVIVASKVYKAIVASELSYTQGAIHHAEQVMFDMRDRQTSSDELNSRGRTHHI